MNEMDDDELLDALGVEVAPLKVSSRSSREERIIAGFEDILRFYDTHKRAPPVCVRRPYRADRVVPARPDPRSTGRRSRFPMRA